MSDAALIPRTVADFETHRACFEAWLIERGSEILLPTSEWELIRFSVIGGVAVVHRNKKGEIKSWGNNADSAFLAYRKSTPWRGSERAGRSGGGKGKRERIEMLLKRDGHSCCFCNKDIPEGEWTIEHFVPLTAGGPDRLSNLMLAHKDCNNQASHASAREKIELIVRIRMEGVTA